MNTQPGELDRIHGGYVKIVRFGERFWLSKCRRVDGVWTGVVDNNLLVAPFPRGKRISFDTADVIETMDGAGNHDETRGKGAA